MIFPGSPTHVPSFSIIFQHLPVVFVPKIPHLPSSPVLLPRLTGLRKLTASYNALTQLPESIGDCQVLEKIRVVNNHITAAGQTWSLKLLETC